MTGFRLIRHRSRNVGQPSVGLARRHEKPYVSWRENVSSPNPIDRLLDRFVNCPWNANAGFGVVSHLPQSEAGPSQPLYTPQERRRRDESPWTTVQGVLAPFQFVVFLISFALVIHFLRTGEGYYLATASIVAKTLVLYTIMVTGSIWEKEVFGKWLFAPAFFWEDVFSILVLALHTAYLVAIVFSIGTVEQQMWLALAAYAAYVVNAGQFLLKLRAARLESAGHGGFMSGPRVSGADA